MEKPILFNTDMVKAILEGRKTVTRRIIKNKYENADITFFENKYGKRLVYMQNDVPGPVKNSDGTTTHRLTAMEEIKKPYNVGDILWVRETWNNLEDDEGDNFVYKADDGWDELSWKPSIHMPRVAARIFLRVTCVRAERLQDISENDVKAEGIRAFTKDGQVYKYSHVDEFNWREAPRTAREAFQKLWDSCYNWPKCWIYNPYVWVIEFERVNQ